jgi:hypothetical protein
MRKNFSGPVWLLVIFGVLQLGFSYSGILTMFRLFRQAEVWERGNVVLFVCWMLLWPVVIFGEAVVYWMIRKRNRAQMLSWTHTVIFCIALVLNASIAVLAILHEPIIAGLRTRQGRIVEMTIFWALVIVSHIAFVQMLVLAYRKEPPLRKVDGESENLLDDVVL